MRVAFAVSDCAVQTGAAADARLSRFPLANITRRTVSSLLRPRLKSVNPGSTT
jgi:hypothetical protein